MFGIKDQHKVLHTKKQYKKYNDEKSMFNQKTFLILPQRV